MVGGQAIFEDLGIQLENLQLSDLGTAKKVSVDKDNATIIEGGGKPGEIKSRIEQIRRELENSWREFHGELKDCPQTTGEQPDDNSAYLL